MLEDTVYKNPMKRLAYTCYACTKKFIHYRALKEHQKRSKHKTVNINLKLEAYYQKKLFIFEDRLKLKKLEIRLLEEKISEIKTKVVNYSDSSLLVNDGEPHTND